MISLRYYFLEQCLQFRLIVSKTTDEWITVHRNYGYIAINGIPLGTL